MTVPRVSPTEALALVEREGFTLLDVRTVAEFDAGHPAGAFNVPISVATPRGMAENVDFVPVVRARFPRDTKLALCCRSGSRSARAARALADAGFTDLVDVGAGFGGTTDAFGQLQEPGWKALGLPVAVQAAAGRSYAELASGTAPIADKR